MLKAKSSKNFLSQKLCKILTFALEIRGYEKMRFLLKKGTPLREYTSFEPFCVKVRWGSDPKAEIEKSQKVTRGSHRNDASQLTQGLCYRAACDLPTIAN